MPYKTLKMLLNLGLDITNTVPIDNGTIARKICVDHIEKEMMRRKIILFCNLRSRGSIVASVFWLIRLKARVRIPGQPLKRNMKKIFPPLFPLSRFLAKTLRVNKTTMKNVLKNLSDPPFTY